MELKEIERKFLVKNQDFKKESHAQFKIAQGYLSMDPERSVRIRIRDNQGFLTIKGAATNQGTTRFEWETAIPLKDAEALMTLCLPGTIEKIRYLVNVGKHTFEVDEFFGKNQGLVMAEIELQDKDESFEIPDWLGKEVTGDARYFNSQLGKNPFSTWD